MNYEEYEEAANYISGTLGGFKPEVGIVAGSGLINFKNTLINPIVIKYSDIPHFPNSNSRFLLKSRKR